MDARDAANRDLLIGLLALQNGLVEQDALVVAFRAWTRDKARPIADILAERGAIDAAERALLEGLAETHLRRHGGDAGRSLAALNAGRSTRESLAGVGDPDIEATLAQVGSRPAGGGAEHTATYQPGGPTTDGRRFRVLRPHARGGLGEVFVALDEELHREVALKQILGHHADDPNSRTRFVLEAEITGGLEHPGIVPVYGLGSYGDGRPYYAMRFVRGDSLKEAVAAFHADESLRADPGKRSLALRKLLRRFVDVCNAIDYAHTRGVLHRDIKPANVIVGKHGETLVVDWGLAKLMGKSEPGSISGEQTLMPSSAGGSAETLPGSALGTPAYMSPEQASGDLDRLGPQSDVYSLGATLYCVLTGKSPFEGDDLGAVLRAVRKGEFPHPRAADPALDRALEAVCLKAMALEPEGRYPTPRALADDVERWAADEPVTAWREPPARRARRWARRNRTAVTALAASMLVALVGSGAVLAVQTRANGQLQRANSQLSLANGRVTQANADLKSANDRVTKANADLKSANDREKQRFSLAMDAIRLFHGEVSEDLLLKEKQFQGLRTKLLRGAADFYGRLEDLLKGQTDRESRGALGKAYDELAGLTAKIGDETAALGVYRKALSVRRSLASEPGADAGTKLDVARSLNAAARWQRATGDVAGARASHEEAGRLAEGVGSQGGASEQARAVQGTAYFGMLIVRNDVGDKSGALAAARKALAVRQELVDAHPGVDQLRQDLASVHNRIGRLLHDQGDTSGARAAFGRALAIEQDLADANPDAPQFRAELAASHHSIGYLLSHTGDTTGARAAYGRALAIRQDLADANPGVTQYQYDLAHILTLIGFSYVRSGEPDGAVDYYSREAAIWKRLADANPTVPDYRHMLANCQTNTAEILLRLRRPAEARMHSDRAATQYESLVGAYPSLPAYRFGLAASLLRLGQSRRAEGDLVGTSADWRRAVALSETVPKPDGEQLFYYACCHAALSSLAGLPGTGVSAGEGDAEAVRAMALLRRAAAVGYRDPGQYRTEPALDPIRDRPDFRLLTMDLDFPADPFAHGE